MATYVFKNQCSTGRFPKALAVVAIISCGGGQQQNAGVAAVAVRHRRLPLHLARKRSINQPPVSSVGSHFAPSYFEVDTRLKPGQGARACATALP